MRMGLKDSTLHINLHPLIGVVVLVVPMMFSILMVPQTSALSLDKALDDIGITPLSTKSKDTTSTNSGEKTEKTVSPVTSVVAPVVSTLPSNPVVETPVASTVTTEESSSTSSDGAGSTQSNFVNSSQISASEKPDTRSEVASTANAQSNTPTANVTYRTNMLDRDTARTILLSALATSGIGAFAFALTYLPPLRKIGAIFRFATR